MKGWRAASFSSAWPRTVCTTAGAGESFAAAATLSSNGAATSTRSAPRSATAYSISGCTATARLAGSVQGVVVQMTTESGLSEGSPNFCASASGTGNFTQIEGDTCSLYSISASASAVSKGIDQ